MQNMYAKHIYVQIVNICTITSVLQDFSDAVGSHPVQQGISVPLRVRRYRHQAASGHDAAEERHKPNQFASYMLSLLLWFMGPSCSSGGHTISLPPSAGMQITARGSMDKTLATLPSYLVPLLRPGFC